MFLGKPIRFEDFDGKDNVVDKEFEWTKDPGAARWANELVGLYGQARDMEEPGEIVGAVADGEVVHIGEDILALGMTVGIDTDSIESEVKAIFLRKEQREAACIAVDAEEARRKVVVTGSPGAGKTFGLMAAVVAEELLRGKTVVRVSHSPGVMHLLVPKKADDGDIIVEAWSAPFSGNRLFDGTGLMLDDRVVAVVDPPEGGHKGSLIAAICRVILVPSDNRDRHYLNWYKNGVVFYVDPPTLEEAEKHSFFMWSSKSQAPTTTLLTGDDLYKEIRRRILIVGPFPRYILGWDYFKERVTAISAAVGRLGLRSGQESFLKGALYRAFDVESGKLHTTYVNKDEARSTAWAKRAPQRHELNQLPLYLILKDFPETMSIITEIRGPSFRGSFFERFWCEPALLKGGIFSYSNLELVGSLTLRPAGEPKKVELSRRELWMADAQTHDAGYKMLEELQHSPDPAKFLRFPTPNFPVADYAMGDAQGSLILINAKTGKNKELNCVTGLNFLRKLGVVEETKGVWETTEKGATFEAPLYYATFGSYEKFTVSITKGDQLQRTLLSKHLKLRWLSIDEALCSKVLADEVREALRHYDPPLLS